jgi:ribosomal protein S12 methylthiotransferase accessory factor
MPIERAFTYKQSNDFLNQHLKKLGMFSEIQQLTENSFTCYLCNLYDATSKKLLAQGFGKGTKRQAILGSQFEALEHYTSNVTNINVDYVYVSLNELKNKNKRIISSKISSQILTDSKYQTKKMVWLEYSNYYNSEDYAYIPASSINPLYLNNKLCIDNFPYEEVYMQSTNNGVAIGCSLDEALIHGLLEIIERDAISQFLLNNFIFEKGEKVTILDPTTLSRRNKIVYETLKKVSHTTPILLILENGFDIPSFCTYTSPPDFLYPVKGFGASLDGEYGLYRSMCECIEQIALYENIVQEETAKALDAFTNIPRLMKCVLFNINELIKKNGLKLIPFDFVTYNKSNLLRYKKSLFDKVFEKKSAVYYKVLYNVDNIFTVHLVMPSANECFSILNGVLPPINHISIL